MTSPNRFLDRAILDRLRAAGRGMVAGAVSGALCLGLLAGAPAQAETPLLVGYQAAVFDDQGQPAAGPVDVEIAIFDSASGGTELYAESHANVSLVDGAFDLQIGSGANPSGAFDETTFAGANAWLELTVEGETLDPRQRLVAVPYALRAKVAESLDGSIGTVPHALVADALTGTIGAATDVQGELISVNTDEQGNVFDDGARIYFDHGYLGSSTKDALVIEKTDANSEDPDGGIVFANRGTSGISEQALIIDGQGNVGIPTANPSARLHIDVVGQRAANFWAVNDSKTLEVWNGGTAEAIVAHNQGSGRANAAVRVQNLNPDYGVAGRFINDSGAGTVYMTNNGTGPALILEGNGGDDVISAWDYSDGSATAKRFWVDPNGVTNVRTLKIHGGADLSEQFTVRSANGASAEPGTVVSIDPGRLGGLMVSDRAYDSRVAGIVAGAGGVQPGLVLRQEGVAEADGQVPVALSGRVYVKADASGGGIEAGDLLTTSSRAGFAMRVDDKDRADGAILGKAMGRVDSETGMVLVLVNLH